MSTTETTTTETTTTDVQTTVEKPYTLEDFVNEDYSNDPKLSKEMTGEHKGLPSYTEILKKHTTEEGRKLIQNLRADYSRKAAELANERKALEAEKKRALAEKDSWFNGDAARQIQEAASKSTEGLDPWSEEGLAALIEKKAAEKLQALLAPQREAILKEEKALKVKQFKAEHPDMETEAFKAVLIPILEAAKKTGTALSMEEVYYLAKGKLAEQEKAAIQAEKNAKRDVQKSFVQKTVGTTRLDPNLKPPKGLSATQLLNWVKEHSV